MEFKFVPITIEHLNEIIKWRYDGYEKSIYCDSYFTNYKTNKILRGPNDCIGFAVLRNEELSGLFEYYLNDEIMEIGLALAPHLVGCGLGKSFVLAGIKFGVERFHYQKNYLKLQVNIHNIPAIKVYEKAGFIVEHQDNDEIEMRFYLN